MSACTYVPSATCYTYALGVLDQIKLATPPKRLDLTMHDNNTYCSAASCTHSATDSDGSAMPLAQLAKTV